MSVADTKSSYTIPESFYCTSEVSNKKKDTNLVRATLGTPEGIMLHVASIVQY